MSCSYFIDKLLFRGSDSRYFCQTVWSDLAVPRYISSLETLLFSFKQYFFFLQASFISSGNRTDISLDDPNFWQKWAKIAEVEIDSKSEKVESDWANARFLNGRKRRRASEQLRRTRVSNWMENSEAWSVREPRAWSGARGGFRQICWCFHRRKRSFSLVVHFLSACIASSHFWVVGIKFIMKNWFCFSDVDSCLLVSSSLVFFFWGCRSLWWLTPHGWGSRPVITTLSRTMNWWSSQSWTATRRKNRVGHVAWVNAAGGTSVPSASEWKRTCSSLGIHWEFHQSLKFGLLLAK